MTTTPFNCRDGISTGSTPILISDVSGNLTGASLSVTGNASAVNITASGTLNAGASTLASILSTSNNLTVGNVTTPTDTTAIGGGLTLRGVTNKTLTWNSAVNGWESSENFNIATGLSYKIAGTSVLNSTTLGTGVINSSLTSVGTITTGNWNASLISPQFGGTGVNNAAKTITLGGNLITSGTFNTTLTATNTTTVTLPTSGTLATLSNAETLTNKTFSLTNNTFTGTSAQLLAGMTDETGTGQLVFASSPTLVTPNIGTPSAGTLTNCTGYTYANLSGIVPTWNQNTTGTAANATNAVTASNSLSLGGSLAANYALYASTLYVGTTPIGLNRVSGSQTLTGVSIDGNSATTTLATDSSRLGGVAASSYAQLAGSTYVGTTAIGLNRTAAAQTLTGISIDGNSATTTLASNSSQLGGVAASSYAQLASPALSGVPTAPTAANGTNNTQIATTAFVLSNSRVLIGSATATVGGAPVLVPGGFGGYSPVAWGVNYVSYYSSAIYDIIGVGIATNANGYYVYATNVNGGPGYISSINVSLYHM